MSEYVYHYCKPKVFNSIIKSKKIWLSDLRKSNDYEEIGGMMARIFAKLPEMLRRERDLFFLGNRERYYAYVASFAREYWEREISPVALWMAMCFSRAEDDLSQWRGYTERATGFAIGVKVADATREITRINHRLIKLKEIVYDEAEHERYSEEAIGRLIEAIRLSEGKTEENIELKIRAIVKRWFAQLVLELAYFKNPSFEAEEEVRLCYSRVIKIQQLVNRSEGSTLNYLGYDVTENDVVAHLEVNYPLELISRIIIGPMNRATPNDIKMLLAVNGFNTENIEVVKSRSTYRG
ncbi:MAG: DUF2971 domain-containing protein [Clostridia bacterium]|nr:DUF2971 domain-containing protein [Clostridia bacterium]